MALSKELMWDELDDVEWWSMIERKQLEAWYSADQAEWTEWTGKVDQAAWTGDCNQGEWHDNLTREQLEAGDREQWAEYADELVCVFTRIGAQDQILKHDEIASAWAMVANEEQHTTHEKYVELKKQYEEIITKAFFDTKLMAVMYRLNQKDVWKRVPTTLIALDDIKDDIRLANQEGFKIDLKIYVDRDNFRSWLINSKTWPLAEGCLLNEWLGNEHQAQVYDAKPASTKNQTTIEKNGRHNKRLEILSAWYADKCSELKDNRELIIEEIDRLTNKEIQDELKAITQTDLKYLWSNGAEVWIKSNGKKVWEFERTPGSKRGQKTKKQI